MSSVVCSAKRWILGVRMFQEGEGVNTLNSQLWFLKRGSVWRQNLTKTVFHFCVSKITIQWSSLPWNHSTFLPDTFWFLILICKFLTTAPRSCVRICFRLLANFATTENLQFLKLSPHVLGLVSLFLIFHYLKVFPTSLYSNSCCSIYILH